MTGEADWDDVDSFRRKNVWAGVIPLSLQDAIKRQSKSDASCRVSRYKSCEKGNKNPVL